ncbi:MAG: bacillithiol biosynthesis cysteine-adding enzyme BshC [Pyrinomonadaceae bacterium]|nr:bacillithiol biosynthesis cysteine-adding enzyme BshC [Pyrinomonadaceae bacterium]
MSTTEAACYSSPEDSGLRIETLPVERIAHGSRLFLDYLRDPLALRHFYPSAVRFHYELATRAPEVLAAYKTDRTKLCNALEAMNIKWGASPETIANITRLRSDKCVAAVSGQQVGLFTGPLYTIYKALSAVKLAGCLSHRGTEAVPIFWMATEDHDWAEVQTAEFIGCDGRLASTGVSSDIHKEGAPVGGVVLDESINDTIKRLLDVLPTTEFSPELEKLMCDAYMPGRTYGEAFARMLAALTGRYGLVLLDPLDPQLKQLAAPLYAEAVRAAPEIAAALEARNHELEQAGYHPQVLVSAHSFPLFLHSEGARRALTRTSNNGHYRAKGTNQEYALEELAERAVREPENFSPNVTLRAVVQDHLLPTIAYFGGGAEIAYFAQTAEVYRVLQRPVTPILHRASLTVVEHRTSRTLERYNLHLSDFLEGLDSVIARVVEEHLGAETAHVFDRTEATVARALDELRTELLSFDPTLAEALETGKNKINYQLTGLRTRFHRAQMARDRAVHRQLERAFTALYPEKTLQERRINVTSLIARHGHYVIDWIHNAIDLRRVDHRIIYL